jgi:hypothetical protein
MAGGIEGCEGETGKEAYTVHIINIISQSQYFVVCSLNSYVGNVVGLPWNAIISVEPGTSSVVKHKKEKLLRSGQRVFVLNIFNKFRETNPGLAVEQIEKLTGEICVVSASTVHSLRTEFT